MQGNRQPYAPEHTLTAALGFESGPLKTELEAQHVGKQFTDFANTVAPSADGQRGEMPAFTVWNTTVNYTMNKATTAFLSAKNLFDKTYISDRSRGIVPGMPRLVQVGIKHSF